MKVKISLKSVKNDNNLENHKYFKDAKSPDFYLFPDRIVSWLFHFSN
jgi:hypothetical protein